MARAHIAPHARGHASYAKRISTHIAYALVAYTLLLIFLVSPELESKDMSIWPYFALVALVGAIILPCRNIERRWQRIDDGSDALRGQFLVARIKIWVGAIGIPILLTLLFKGMSAA